MYFYLFIKKRVIRLKGKESCFIILIGGGVFMLIFHFRQSKQLPNLEGNNKEVWRMSFLHASRTTDRSFTHAHALSPPLSLSLQS